MQIRMIKHIRKDPGYGHIPAGRRINPLSYLTSRSQEVPSLLLEGYRSYLMTDDYMASLPLSFDIPIYMSIESLIKSSLSISTISTQSFGNHILIGHI